MAIWLTKDSKVIVQGMTGSEGSKHTRRMLAAGTKIVGGVTPGKGGQRSTSTAPSVPVFDSVAEAMAATGADVSVIFVPPAFAKAAVVEAVDAGIPLAVVITEGIPVHDSAGFWAYNVANGGTTRIIGPNCPGIASPGAVERRHHPGRHHPAPAGSAWSRKSGTLTYQMMYELRDIGFSTGVGIGGDPVIGTTHIDALAGVPGRPGHRRDRDDRRDRRRRRGAGGRFIKANVTKPVVGYIAGFTAPEGKTMGHAGAIISGSAGTAEAKKVALEAAGSVGKTPSETARLMREVMQSGLSPE